MVEGTGWRERIGDRKMDTFRELFERNVRSHQEDPAVIDPAAGIRLTYGELDALAGRVAAKLQAGGVGKGDVVAVVLPHSIECIASMLAAVKLGAAFAPLNGTYPPDRLAYIFHDCQAKAVITPDFMKDVADYSPAAGNAPITLEDAALLVYTSGSTGRIIDGFPRLRIKNAYEQLNYRARSIEFAGLCLTVICETLEQDLISIAHQVCRIIFVPKAPGR